MDGQCLEADAARALEDVWTRLRRDASVADALGLAADALGRRGPLGEAVLLCFDEGGAVAEVAIWRAEDGASGGDPASVAAWNARLASPAGRRVLDGLRAGREPDPDAVEALLAPDRAEDAARAAAPENGAPAQLTPLRGPDGLAGLLALRPPSFGDARRTAGGDPRFVRLLAAGLALFCGGRVHFGREVSDNRALDAALAQTGTCIYVTDPRTDRILYMNRAMRDTFGLDRPEGRICWQVLQRGRSGRCSYCPVPHLEKRPAERSVYRWEEYNGVTGRVYENYDSLLPWGDGTLAHLQQSVDVTDMRRLSDEVNRDELTGLTNRRAGMAALADVLAGPDDVPLTVAVIDVDSLNDVNSEYGQAEGDRVLRLVARSLDDETRSPDFCFRLGGDEFAAVFRGCGRYAAVERLERLRGEVAARGADLGLPYPPGYCFGVFEVGPGGGRAVDEVLAHADESMYEQKKQLHIREAERRMAAREGAGAGKDAFPGDARLLYQALVRSTDSYIYVSDMRDGVFHYSPAMVAEFALPGEVVANAAAVWGERVHPEDRAAFLEANQIVVDGRTDAHCVEYRVRNRRGDWVWVRCRGHVARDENGRAALFAGFITNLGQRNKIDPVTGLFNKIKLAEDVAALVSDRPDRRFFLMLMGLDGFRHVNDLYGKSFGDEVLRVSGQRMQVMLSDRADLYRLDGDEFGLLVHEDGDEAAALYRMLSDAFRHQREYAGKKYFCTLSAGIAGYPLDAGDYGELLRCAGSALEAAKSAGKNRMAFFRREQIELQRRSLELIELLRESIERDFAGFDLHYQPQVTAEDGRVMGAEALARWTCAPYGAVSPAEFIPLLEQSGLIVPFGRWVFARAAAQCKEWTAVRPDLTVSVNLSYLQVTSDNMLDFIRATLDKLDLNPANLVVEFTESCMIQGDEAIQALFDGLRGLGIHIAMDDFGTGYSSLGMLKTLPADVVKIDRTFVRDILHSKFDETFIRFVVELCHHVDIKVCLEGVERNEEMRLVEPLRLDFIQGYLFGRPMSADMFLRTMLEPAGA